MVFIRAFRFSFRATSERRFQSLNRDGVHSRQENWKTDWKTGSFNPSIGMVFIRAYASSFFPFEPEEFQSLNRDGVHSRLAFSLFLRGSLGVSIPQSGWCSFARGGEGPVVERSARFNPSIGMVFIRAGQRVLRTTA